MIEVARRLSRGDGQGGTDLISLQHWLLQFGEASGKLWQIFTEFAEWLENERPPWATYIILMSGRLIGLNKHPGVRPVGVGEAWRRLMANCVVKVTGQELKEACGTNQICGGTEEGIEEGIKVMLLL